VQALEQFCPQNNGGGRCSTCTQHDRWKGHTKLRRHLANTALKNKKVQLKEGYVWAKTSVREPAAQAIIKAYRDFGY